MKNADADRCVLFHYGRNEAGFRNYLKMEKGYAENWANYIERQNMTMDEALDYIKNSNSQKDRHAHIVDMDRGFRSSK